MRIEGEELGGSWVEGIVFESSKLDTVGATQSCGQDGTRDADVPAPGGAQRHDGPEMKVTVLTSSVPGPFGAGATDSAPGTAWGVVAERSHGSDLALLWGYLPLSDDRTWVPSRTILD